MFITGLLTSLLSTAVVLRRELSISYSRSSMLILIYCTYIIYYNQYTEEINSGIGIFNGLFNINCYSNYLHGFIYIISISIMILTGFFPYSDISSYQDKEKIYNKNGKEKMELDIPNFGVMYYNKNYRNNIKQFNKENYEIIEYSLIMLFILQGATLLMSTNDIVSIFLSIELQSYGLYLFCTLYRNSELATSAGLTYFLLGGLSSCFILLGTSILYINSGSTSLDNIYIINNISSFSFNNTNFILSWYGPYYIYISLLIISIGFLFKVSAAPFHFWSPDVYDGIPTNVTTFVAIIAKIPIFVFLLELVNHINNSILSFAYDWKLGLLISSLLSLIIGTLLGLVQFRIKRLYAYSTISHIGFILLALHINKIESVQSFIFYLMQYSFSNLNAFIILIAIGYTLHTYVNKDEMLNNLIEKNNSPIQLISQLKGYFKINPLLAISLSITLFSFIGIPPLIGFFAKQSVLTAALNNGYIFITLIAILTSVISAVYYLVIIKQIFFDELNYKIIIPLNELTNNSYFSNYKKTTISNSFSFIISMITLIILFFIFTPQEWLNMSNILSILIIT